MIIRQINGPNFNTAFMYNFMISKDDEVFTTKWWRSEREYPNGYTYHEVPNRENQMRKVYENITE